MIRPKTYCNPLSITGVKSGRWLDAKLTKANERDFKDYRSISDPSVVYYVEFLAYLTLLC